MSEPQSPAAVLDRFQADIDYFESHRTKLLERYPEQWVAMIDKQVIGAAPNVDLLLAKLREQAVPTERLLIRHLTRKEDLLIV